MVLKLKNFEGARAYKVPKNLFRDITIMIDENKPASELLTIMETFKEES